MIGGGGKLGLPELEPQEEGVKNTYYHGFTPLNAWMKSCVPTAVRCFTSKRSTIFLCRAIRTCLPTTWPLRRRGDPAVPRDRCGLCPDANGGERAVKVENFLRPPRRAACALARWHSRRRAGAEAWPMLAAMPWPRPRGA